MEIKRRINGDYWIFRSLILEFFEDVDDVFKSTESLRDKFFDILLSVDGFGFKVGFSAKF